jgi:hypothetical protein
MSSMAFRQKRWSSVSILQASCLLRFLFPHWAWRLPCAACLFAHGYLSCSFQARPSLLVRHGRRAGVGYTATLRGTSYQKAVGARDRGGD